MSFVCASLLVLTVACGDDKSDGSDAAEGAEGASETAETSNAEASEAEAGDGDGDGDTTTTGDGDGDATTTGDGDGDATTTGDGDGDPTGDGDGDPTTGDGDGDPNLACVDLETQDECDANPDCQSVVGSHLKQNGPNAPCLEPQEFVGCIAMQGCGDAISWFCSNNNQMWQIPDTCGPDNADPCDAPADPVDACP